MLRPVGGACGSAMDGAGIVLRVVEAEVDGVSDVVLVGDVLGDVGVKVGQEWGESLLQPVLGSVEVLQGTSHDGEAEHDQDERGDDAEGRGSRDL